MKRSRAHYLGVSPARLQRQFARFEKVTRRRAEEIAYAWGEVDNFVVSEMDGFLDGFSALEQAIKEAIERLRAQEDEDEAT